MVFDCGSLCPFFSFLYYERINVVYIICFILLKKKVQLEETDQSHNSFKIFFVTHTAERDRESRTQKHKNYILEKKKANLLLSGFKLPTSSEAP